MLFCPSPLSEVFTSHTNACAGGVGTGLWRGGLHSGFRNRKLQNQRELHHHKNRYQACHRRPGHPGENASHSWASHVQDCRMGAGGQVRGRWRQHNRRFKSVVALVVGDESGCSFAASGMVAVSWQGSRHMVVEGFGRDDADGSTACAVERGVRRM